MASSDESQCWSIVGPSTGSSYPPPSDRVSHQVPRTPGGSGRVSVCVTQPAARLEPCISLAARSGLWARGISRAVSGNPVPVKAPVANNVERGRSCPVGHPNYRPFPGDASVATTGRTGGIACFDRQWRGEGMWGVKCMNGTAPQPTVSKQGR